MRKALYPGSFDPITYGHIDIINRASNLFDEVTIAIFDNPNKHAFFNFEERKSLIEQVLSNHKNIKK